MDVNAQLLVCSSCPLKRSTGKFSNQMDVLKIGQKIVSFTVS